MLSLSLSINAFALAPSQCPRSGYSPSQSPAPTLNPDYSLASNPGKTVVAITESCANLASNDSPSQISIPEAPESQDGSNQTPTLTSKKIYNKYVSKRDVEAIYVTPSMVGLFTKTPYLEGVDISKAIKGFKAMYILESSNRTANPKLQADIQTLIDQGSYEMILQASDSGELARAYIKMEEQYITELIIYVTESGEVTFVSILGRMGLADFAALASKIEF